MISKIEINGREFNFSLRNLEKTHSKMAKQPVNEADLEDFICMNAGGFNSMTEFDSFCDGLNDEQYELLKTTYTNAHMSFVGFQAKKVGLEDPTKKLKKELKESFQKQVQNNIAKK